RSKPSADATTLLRPPRNGSATASRQARDLAVVRLQAVLEANLAVDLLPVGRTNLRQILNEQEALARDLEEHGGALAERHNRNFALRHRRLKHDVERAKVRLDGRHVDATDVAA